jgi:hypothetical protein
LDSIAHYQKSSESANRQSSSHSNREDQLGHLSSETLTLSKKAISTSTVNTCTSAGNVNASNGMSFASDIKKLDDLNTDSNISKSRVPKLSSSFSTPDLASAARLIGHCSTNFNVNANANDILLEADNHINHPVQLPNVTTAGDIAGSNNVCRFYQQGYCQRGERCSYSHTNVFNGLGQANMTQMAGFQGVTQQPMNNNTYYGQYGLTGMGGINMLTSTGYNYNQSLALNVNPNNNMRLMHANNVSLSKINQKRMSGDLEGKLIIINAMACS